MLLAPSAYGEPIPITRRLLEDGEEVAVASTLSKHRPSDCSELAHRAAPS